MADEMKLEVKIDEAKLEEVKKIIDAAASIMLEADCDNDKQACKELEVLQDKLRELTGKDSIDIKSFREYWECVDLETIARSTLNPEPKKEQISDEHIRKIVKGIYNVEFSESDTDYWLQYLEINTGLPNVSDYIFYPELVGMEGDPSMEEVVEKIISDSKELSKKNHAILL